jgi:hypothetical protein
MAILLEFKYDKRLGLPGYSSHDFGVSMRTEVNNVDQIQEESERAYRLLQQSVDAQLSNPGFVPSENGKETESKGNQTNGTDPQKWNCTERQRGLILKILSQNDLPESAVEQVAQDLHGQPMATLGKMQVSTVISEVLDRWGKHKRTNGRAA